MGWFKKAAKAITKPISNLLGGSSDSAAKAQAAAMQRQLDELKSAEAAAASVQVASNPETVQQNVDENAQINAENEEAQRRRRATLANTYNSNARLYGAFSGKSILGG